MEYRGRWCHSSPSMALVSRQAVGVIIITKRASRGVFIWSPTMEISLSTSTLLPAKTLWTILRHLTGTMQEHEVFIRLGIRLARKVILRLSLSMARWSSSDINLIMRCCSLAQSLLLERVLLRMADFTPFACFSIR